MSGDSGLNYSQNEEQDDQGSSSAWLDFVDWSLMDSDIWNDGAQPSTDITDFNFDDFDFDDFDFQCFGDQFVGKNATSTSPQLTPQEQSDTSMTGMDRDKPGPPDSPSAPIMDQKIANKRLEKLRSLERGRAEVLEIPGAESPASRASPSPRRRGRLSDVVRRGIEELKHAKGACWRCKILRKKVSSNVHAQHQCREYGDPAKSTSSAT